MTKRISWTQLYEDNPGGKYVRETGKGVYQVIEWTDMDDACGRDNEGHPKYVVELSLIDLNEIGEGNIKSALDSHGWTLEDISNDLMLVEAVHSYGCRAPLEDVSSNNLSKSMREIRRLANELLDEDALEEAMDRTVNKIGSTAREFMKGDIYSAMERGVLSGNQDAVLCARMYGVPQEELDNARPEDWLPYVFGYNDGRNNLEGYLNSEDVAETYILGHKRGVAVREGKANPPGWIR